ncbi:retrovirus-related pol polyprotein from transposon TNT 1-94 [Tanacetum coccineum]
MRYVDMKPNMKVLKKFILNGPYVMTRVLVPIKPVTEIDPPVPEQTIQETYENTLLENRAYIDAEAEEIHMILSGIGDEIYSTVDTCKQLKKCRQPLNDCSKLEVATMQVNVQFLQLQPEWSRFVTVVKQTVDLDKELYHKLFDILKQYQNEVSEIRAEKIARNANPLILVAAAQHYPNDNYYHAPKPHKNQTTSSRHTSSTSSYASTKNKGKEVAKPITLYLRLHLKKIVIQNRKPKRVKDYSYHKERMMLCKHEEKGVPLSAEQSDWLQDIDEESDRQHYKQPKTINDTYVMETVNSNVIPDHSYMCNIEFEDDQNVDDNDEDERVKLANLIANLKLDIDENKKIQKQLRKENITLNHELKESKSALTESNDIRDRCRSALHQKEVELEKYITYKNFQLEKEEIEHLLMPLAEKARANASKFEKLLKEEMFDDLHSMTDIDKYSEMACKYLEKLKECECLEIELFKQKDTVSKEDYHKQIQDLKAQLKDRDIAISKLKKLIEKSKGKSVETKFDKPPIVCQTNAIKVPKPSVLGSNLSNVPSSSNSLAYCTNDPIHCTVRFHNDQFAQIISYGDLVQGNITIKRVYYVEGLNHNLFSVGQFCDADMEVGFRKSTCYIRDLQGNDILTNTRGFDLYIIALQESSSPTPICFLAKASPTQAWLWHHRLSHLNFDTINLILKNDIMNGLPKFKFVKDQLCSSCELDPEMCMFALTVSTTEPTNIKEAMDDHAWIEAMQEELHQFVNPDHPEKVYRLKKALYGLKQALRAWYDELSTFLMSKGFTKGTIDHTLFKIRYGEDILLAKYALEILKKHGMDKYDSIGTPMATKPKMDADLSGTPVEQTRYRSMTRSLMYLTSSRPNIVQEVCYCARYQAIPTEKHLKEVKRIFRYLKGTINMGLWYPKDSGFELTAFSDADHAGCLNTRKSTSGGIQFLGEKLVSWMSKKQDCTIMFTTKA